MAYPRLFSAGLKLLLLLSAASAAVLPAQGKCVGSGLSVWPRGQTVPPNALLVVDGYSASQALIRGLGSTYAIYLRSATERVPLEVQQVLTGDFEVTQAVLKPRRALKVGQQYELVITEARPKGADARNLVFDLHRRRVAYRVVAGHGQKPPMWQAAPTETGREYTEYGCGPAASVTFSCPVPANYDGAEYLVKATVRNLSSGRQTTYYVAPDPQHRLVIGHGMCGGPFVFSQSPAYTITFALLDAAGNTAAGPGQPIRFAGPAPSPRAPRQPMPLLPGE